MNINPESRTVEVWLTTREAHDPALKAHLRVLYQVFAAQKYLTAEFHSGSRELAQSASDLLCYNRKRIAQLAVERENRMESAG